MDPLTLSALMTGGSAIASLFGASQASKAAKESARIEAAASNAATEAQQKAMREALALQQKQYGAAMALLAPTARGGRRAQSYIDAVLYGGRQGAAGAARLNPADQWAAYVEAYPDLKAEFQRLRAEGDRQSISAFGEAHFRDNGQAEGRTVPDAPTGGAAVGAAEAASAAAPVSAARARAPDWSAYLAAYPDVMAEYRRLQGGKGVTSFSSPEAYAEYHHSQFGRNEGRALPMMDDPLDSGVDTMIGGRDYADLFDEVPAVALDEVMAAYRDTPFFRMSEDAIAAESVASDLATRKAVEEMLHRAGAAGSAISGNALRGEAELRNEFGVQNAVNAALRRASTFGGWYDQLGGEAATGRDALGSMASGGQNFTSSAASLALGGGRSAADNILRTADATARGREASAAAWGRGVNSALEGAMSAWDLYNRTKKKPGGGGITGQGRGYPDNNYWSNWG